DRAEAHRRQRRQRAGRPARLSTPRSACGKGRPCRPFSFPRGADALAGADHHAQPAPPRPRASRMLVASPWRIRGWSMFGWLERLRAAPVEIGDEAWHGVMARSALFERLDGASRTRLRGLAGRFLARKSFSAAAGHVLDDGQCLAIAVLACLPVLHVGFDALAGWR